MAANETSFKRGQSGNPNGRPKLTEIRDGKTIVDLARVHTEEAFETVLEIMRDATAARRDRLMAALAIHDRGWGKPNTPVDLSADGSIAETLLRARERAQHEVSNLFDEQPGSSPGTTGNDTCR
jgi:hypothetical protein